MYVVVISCSLAFLSIQSKVATSTPNHKVLPWEVQNFVIYYAIKRRKVVKLLLSDRMRA